MEIVVQILLLAVGFVMLIKGADLFVDGAAGTAERFGIPQLIIGLTVVAMGTSAPEMAVSISAALKGSADITVGNVVGSNILNVLLILGITALISPVSVEKSTIKCEIPYMIFITLILLILGYTGGYVYFAEGAVLWGLFILYLVYLFVTAAKQKDKNGVEEHKKQPVWKLLLSVAGGLALIIFGSDVSVDAAVKIAEAAGISERFIGLTVVALGTSLPELVTSVSAARKGNSGIAVGNIVGSNIFNILFIIGTTAFITPVKFAENFIFDTLIAAAAGVVLLLGVLKDKRLGRIAGAIMLLCYAGYFVCIL